MVTRLTRTTFLALDRGAGAMRSTGVHVNVLCNDVNPPFARMTRAVVSVLCADGTIFVDAANSLGWNDAVSHNFVVRTTSNSLGWSADIGQDYAETIKQYIGWTPRVPVDCSNSLFSETALSGQFLNNVEFHTCENNFGFVEDVYQAYNAANVLTWAQTATPVQLVDATNSLGLVDAVDSSGTEFTRDDTTQSLFRQHLSYTISGTRCVEKEYSPFVGTEPGDDSYGPISVTPPVLTHGTLTLTYPRVSPTTTLVLKNPAFGNTDTITFSMVAVETRGGDRITFADPKWGSVQIRNMAINNICETLVDDIVSFINESLGKEIGLLDWEGRNWKGVILQNPGTNPIVQTGRNAYSFTLTFQGELV